MIQQIAAFIHSDAFYRSTRRVIGVIIPLVIFRLLDMPETGLTIMSGALIVMGLDLPTNFKRKALLISTAAIINTTIILIIVLIHDIDIALAVFLFVVLFSLSFISLFSEPYTLMTIFATIAILISLGSAESIQTLHDWALLGIYTLAGSAWYLLYASFLHYLGHPSSIARNLRWSLQLTEQYLTLQADILSQSISKEEILKNHAKVRDALIDQKAQLEKILARESQFIYHRQRNFRQIFPALETLVQIWDRALGHTLDFENWALDENSKQLPAQFESIIDFQGTLASAVRKMAHLIHPTGLGSIGRLDNWKDIVVYLPKGIPDYPTDELNELTDYQQSTCECLKALALQMGRAYEHEKRDIPLSLSTQLYESQLEWSKLRQSLHVHSRAFRHALRIAVVGVTGFFIGRYLHLANPSWILLTSVVILNPDYRSSKQRVWLRIIGTLIGVFMSIGLHMLSPGPWGNIVIFALSLQIAFAFLSFNYAVSSAFFSLFILFLYSYQQIDFFESAIYRVIDTFIGASLAYVGVRYAITFWEHQSLSRRVRRSLEANQHWVRSLSLLGKGLAKADERAYDLAQEKAFARQKEMFVAVARMKAEPLANANLHASYEAFLLQNEQLLISLSALGERLRYHTVGKLSTRFSSLQREVEEKLATLSKNWSFEEKYTSGLEERAILSSCQINAHRDRERLLSSFTHTHLNPSLAPIIQTHISQLVSASEHLVSQYKTAVRA